MTYEPRAAFGVRPYPGAFGCFLNVSWKYGHFDSTSEQSTTGRGEAFAPHRRVIASGAAKWFSLSRGREGRKHRAAHNLAKRLECARIPALFISSSQVKTLTKLNATESAGKAAHSKRFARFLAGLHFQPPALVGALPANGKSAYLINL